jgi:hypothetical protein
MGEWKQNMAFENTVSEAKEEGTVNTDQELEQIDVEMGDMTFIHFKPRTAITGTFPENEGNPIIRFWDEQHNNGRKDQGYIGLVFDNPSASVSEEEGTDGTIVLDVADSNEIRLFNTDDNQTELLGDVGVQYGDRMYRGDVIDEIPDERAIVIVSGSASTNVARKFDVNGEPLAGMDENGNKVDGLIELPNGADTDVYSRYAREPELREELYGSEAGVMVVRRELFDPEYAAQVEAGDARPMKYFLVQGDTGDGVERLETTTGTPVNSSFLEWNWNDTETGAIPDQDLEFVNEYQRSGNSTDSETVRDFIDANRDSLTGETSDEQLVSMIQE